MDNLAYTDYPNPPGLKKPDVSAPGVNIMSLSGFNNTSYRVASGTSMAAPHVAGLIALLLSKAPYLTPRQIDSLLEVTALDLGTAGKDNYFGAGRIRADSAVFRAPAPPFPIVSYETHTISDDGSNGILDICEASRIIVSLKNRGASASNIRAYLRISSPYITLTDTTGSFGTLGTNESGDNDGDRFSLTVSCATPPGHVINCILRITADGGYTNYDTFTVIISNYPREHANIILGASDTLTITNFGSYGFFDPTATVPIGKGFKYSGYNYMFSANLMLGYSQNRVLTGERGFSSELVPVSSIESSPRLYGDREFFSTLCDTAGGLLIQHRAITWASAPNNKICIMRYMIMNPTDSALTYRLGLYADYDITYASSAWQDRARWTAATQNAYMWDHGTPVTRNGFVGMTGVSNVALGSIVKNKVYVYPDGQGWADSTKFRFLTGTYSASFADSNLDWSVMLSSGTRTIASGGLDTIVFAFVAGSSEAEFITNAATARSLSTLVLGVSEENRQSFMPDLCNLSSYPNPFNSRLNIETTPLTTIEILSLDGHIVGRIYSDISGLCYWEPSSLSSSGLYIIKSGQSMTRVLLIR